MSGTVRNTRGNIPYCSAECARTVETDTRSSLYKEDFSLENSIAAFRYVNAVADYDGKPIFWHYGIQGYSIAEIAAALGMKEDTVYKRLGRLKQKIKKLLG